MAKQKFEDHLIDLKIVDELVKNYDNKNYKEINSKRPSGKPDSKEYHFSLEILQEYLEFVKKEAAKKGYINVRIAVKMGQYPEKDVIGPLQKPDTKGYQTVCFVPFYDEPTIAGKNSEENKAPGSAIPGMNFGDICPPH